MAVSESLNQKVMYMVREPQADGTYRYKRIAWDVITINELTGLSAMPASPFPLGEDVLFATAGTDILKINNDMYLDETRHDDNDDVVRFEYFDSESQFLEMLCEHTTCYYVGDTTQSIEAGYPRS